MSEMGKNEKRVLVIGGIVVAGVIIWLLLQKAGTITPSTSTSNPTLGGITLGGNSYTAPSDVFSIGAPGAVTFTYSTPAAAGSADGAVAPCNCPDVSTIFFGDTTDQAASVYPSLTDLMSSLGATLDKLLPLGASNAFGGNSQLQNRLLAYKAQQAEYNTPAGDINAAFAAMQLG